MKSIVELDIDQSHVGVAKLFADPENNPKWIDDLTRYEALSGESGMPGSTYRLVPRSTFSPLIGTLPKPATVV
jgi:hypothetical protein